MSESLTEPQIDLQEIMDTILVCQHPGGCDDQAHGVTSHGPTPTEIKCSCFLCFRHWMQDKIKVRIAMAAHLVGDCGFCGEKEILPEHVYFREL